MSSVLERHSTFVHSPGALSNLSGAFELLSRCVRSLKFKRKVLVMVISINGVQADLPADARVSPLDLLREHVHLSGTKKGCNQGACGAYPDVTLVRHAQ
jgi:hypothetical protein